MEGACLAQVLHFMKVLAFPSLSIKANESSNLTIYLSVRLESLYLEYHPS